MCASALPRENRTQNRRWHEQKNVRKHPRHYRLKKENQILIVFGARIPDKTGHQTIVRIPTSPKVCFCTTCKKQNKQNMRWNKQKTLINFISADLWPWIALTSVHSLTMFAVSCSSESIRRRLGMSMNSNWLVEVWSKTLLTLLLTNWETICVSMFAQRADIWNIFCKQLDNWPIEQTVSQSDRNLDKICFMCVILIK